MAGNNPPGPAPVSLPSIDPFNPQSNISRASRNITRQAPTAFETRQPQVRLVGSGTEAFIDPGAVGTFGVASSDFGDVIDFIGGAIDVVKRIVEPPEGRRNGNGDPGGTFIPLASGCPAGFVLRNGVCEKAGLQGTMQRVVPGGEAGRLTDEFGPAVIGGFGVPAIVPAQVGAVRRRDGTTGPILKCPRGAVLGKDDLCYQKGSIPRSFRKWKPATKPPMTAQDAKALRRIGTLQKKVKGLATTAGLSCSTRRTTRRAPRKC